MHNGPMIKIRITLFYLILLFLFAYPCVFLPFWSDQAIFAYIGDIINRGGLPYMDAWDLKPPVIYYLYSLGLKIFGHSMAGLRFFDYMYSIVTLFAVYHLGTLLFCRQSGRLAAVTLGILYFFTNDFTSLSQCESFMILPMVLSVYFCCSGMKRQSISLFFCSGILAGVVFMTKPTGILVIIPVVLYIFFKTCCQEKKPDVRLIFSRLSAVFSGLAVFAAVVFLWLYKNGLLSEFMYTLFVYDAGHFRSALAIKKDYGHVRLSGFMRRYLFVLIPAFADFVLKKDRNRWPENILLYSWALMAVSGFLLQARFYPYHLLPVIAPLSLLGAQGFLSLWSDPEMNKKIYFFKKKVLFAIIVLAFMFGAIRSHMLLTWHFTSSLVRGNFSEKFYDRFFKFESLGFSINTTSKAAQYIRENSKKEDLIFIWGFQPLVYFLSERYAPSRFFFNAPLVAQFNEKRTSWRESLIADLRKNPPEIILVVKNDILQNQLMSNTARDSLALLNEFPELLKLIEDDYQLERIIDNFFLYRYICDKDDKITTH